MQPQDIDLIGRLVDSIRPVSTSALEAQYFAPADDLLLSRALLELHE